MHLSVALVQLDATGDVAANIATAVALADEAAAGGARLVALPEYLQFRGPDDGYRASARPIPGPHTDPFAEVARRRDAWILVGSTAETSGDPDRPYNTSVLIAPEWVDRRAISQGPPVRRRSRGRSGRHRVRPGDVRATGWSRPTVDGTTVGLSICYDLRFPELYRALALAGATILTVPANFTERTGRDHWEVLLRARAIENAAYVLAPSQIGGPPGQPAFGRSMVVDPWGTIVAQAPDSVAIVRADLDLDRVEALRRQIPVLANRRPDAYANRLAVEAESEDEFEPASSRT